jgi:hypothetical protein
MFKGSTLTGWHPIGEADWHAANGEIVGTAKPGAAGGWLMLDKSLQDVAVFTSFKCAADCKAGLLLRAEKTADGMKGVFISLAADDLNAYHVTLDANGKELTRERLRAGGSLFRFSSVRPEVGQDAGTGRAAAPAPAAAPAQAPGGGGRGGRGGGGGRGGATPAAAAGDASPGGAAPAAPAAAAGRGGGGRGRGAAAAPPGLRPDWNDLDLLLDTDLLRVSLNGGGAIPGGDAGDLGTGFGPIALYVGVGEVHFKDVSYKDLRLKGWPTEQVSSRFHVQRLNPFSYTYSASVADINHDGIPDVIAGAYYYLGPDYTKQREIYLAQTLPPGTLGPLNSRIQFGWDFTGDGWPDVVRIYPGGMALYVNPKTDSRRWEEFDTGVPVSSEIALLKDLFGDGKQEVIYAGGGQYAYAAPDPANPTGKWIIHPISQGQPTNNHGMGVADMNNDGRLDFIAPGGWWEQPPKGTPPGPWTFHPANFGGGGAEMCGYDVNGDGLTDVVTSLAAHGWGLSWFEQKKDGSFEEHPIMGDYSTKNAGDVTFSQLHGSACADLNGDGITDFITGKRYFAHDEAYGDKGDPYGAPVLYVYKTVRNPKAPGGAEFVPELIYNRSGVGSNMVVQDLNKDGALDIVTSTNMGTFIFWGNKGQVPVPK